MVHNPRKTPGLGPLRPLNLPAPIEVEENERQRPVSITLKCRRVKVASIDDLWEIDQEWWREKPIVRIYYEVTLEGDRHIIIFRDQVTAAWYRQGK